MAKKHLTNRFSSRRELLRLFGATGVAMLAGWETLPPGFWSSSKSLSTVKADALSCIVRPEQTEGPYFVDEMLNRSDIRMDPTNNTVKAGTPLRLKINVTRTTTGSCVPLPGAVVDIWHCDALGVYSDVRDTGEGFNTVGQKFLRGYQVTNANGAVEFITIYPGWYTGRTVHIHFKIRLFNGSSVTHQFTSQLYFDDTVTDLVHSQSPYSSKGTRNTRNTQDGIYRNNGDQLLLPVTMDEQGYLATFDIALEGISASESPTISSAVVNGKQLIVTGSNFDSGASLLVNGETQKKTTNDATNPTSILIAKKAGKKIASGQTVTLQVRNPGGLISSEFQFTRP